jgi:site-specific DNA-cytosine methylase
LFSGTASFSKVARERGHECITVDIDPRFKPDICKDVLEFEVADLNGFKPDVVWASPPCQRFSVASMGKSWRGIWHITKEAYQPMNLATGTAIAIVIRTLGLVEELAPRFYFIENPRANLRKMPFMPNGENRKTAWYCRYEETTPPKLPRAKPTDIWTNLVSWNPQTCHNGSKDHEEARRGARTGTQGRKGSIERSIVPRLLCKEIIIACEQELV